MRKAQIKTKSGYIERLIKNPTWHTTDKCFYALAKIGGREVRINTIGDNEKIWQVTN